MHDYVKIFPSGEHIKCVGNTPKRILFKVVNIKEFHKYFPNESQHIFINQFQNKNIIHLRYFFFN